MPKIYKRSLCPYCSGTGRAGGNLADPNHPAFRRTVRSTAPTGQEQPKAGS